MSLSSTIREGWFLGVSLFPEHKGWWGDFLSFADFQEYRDQVKFHTVNLEQKEGKKEVSVRGEMEVRQGSRAYRNSKSPKWYLKCSEMQRTLEQAPWIKSSWLVLLHHSQRRLVCLMATPDDNCSLKRDHLPLFSVSIPSSRHQVNARNQLCFQCLFPLIHIFVEKAQGFFLVNVKITLVCGCIMQPWEGAPGPPKLWEAMQLEKGLGQGCLNHRSNPKELRELSKSHQWWRK